MERGARSLHDILFVDDVALIQEKFHMDIGRTIWWSFFVLASACIGLALADGMKLQGNLQDTWDLLFLIGSYGIGYLPEHFDLMKVIFLTLSLVITGIATLDTICKLGSLNNGDSSYLQNEIMWDWLLYNPGFAINPDGTRPKIR